MAKRQSGSDGAHLTEFLVAGAGQCIAAHAGKLVQVPVQDVVQCGEQRLVVQLCAAQGLGDDLVNDLEIQQILSGAVSFMTSQASSWRLASFHRMLAKPSGLSTL